MNNAAIALKNLMEQLQGVGIYVPGEDLGLWHGLEGMSFNEAENALKEINQQRDHFHLIFAEVIYRTGKRLEVSGTRTNIFTKADTLLFPSRRLNHIQNAAAMQAREDVGNPKVFEVVAVNILAMHYLGEFTDVEFYAGIQKQEVPASNEPVKLSIVDNDATNEA